jgi:hypothetical protein
MKKYGRKDRNQNEILKELEAVGCSVQDLSAVGGGCPDAAVGRAGKTYFLEFKGGEYPSDRKLTDDQVEWHSTWEGHAAVVCSVDEALEAVGL